MGLQRLSLTLGSLILVGGSLGDLYGERRIFTLGVAGFGALSVLCAVAPTIEVLVAGRALQGVFGALLTPSALAVIVSTFAPDERGGRSARGPRGRDRPGHRALPGGWLVDAASWRWIFAINVPFVIVTSYHAAPPSRAPRRRERAPLDVLGAALCALGLAGPVYALIREPSVGWGSPQVVVALVGGAILFGAFMVHEATTPYPMLPLGLFRRRNFAIGNLQTVAMYGGLSTVIFFLVLFLQQVAGYDALHAGLATLPITIVMFSALAARGADGRPLRAAVFMGAGPLVASAGLFLLQRVDAGSTTPPTCCPALLVFALGLSATVAPLTATVLADADEHNAGIASGVNNAIARAAGLLAVAAIGAVVAAQFTRTSTPVSGPDRCRRPGRPWPRASARSGARGGLPAPRKRGLDRRRGRVGHRLPSRGRDSGGARRPGRRARARGDPQPAARCALRGLPRRPAGGRALEAARPRDAVPA